MNWAIEVHGLTRYFLGSTCAVSKLNLTVFQGCVYGLIGLKGSRKTTPSGAVRAPAPNARVVSGTGRRLPRPLGPSARPY